MNAITQIRITPMAVVALIELVAIAAGLGWYFGHRDTPATASTGSIASMAPASNAGMPPSEPRGALQAMSTRPTDHQPPTASVNAAFPGLSASSLMELKRQQAQKQRQLERSFASDPQDPNAAQVELGMLKTMVDPTLISDGIAPGNPEVKCRRGSCLVSGDFSSADDASSWAVNYVTMLGGQLSTSQPVFVQKPDGSVRLQLYGMRR